MAQVERSIDGGVQVLRLNRPEKRNALTFEMYEALTDALIGSNQDSQVKVTLFIGGQGVFSAGNDIGQFVEAPGRSAPVIGFLQALVAAEKPLVAAVDGLAVGIGTTMLLHMDLVYASEAARFHTPFLDLGLTPEAGSSLIMPRRMGHLKAFEMICLGETLSAADALAANLVNRVVAAGELAATSMMAARRLAAKPAGALAAARRLMRGDADILARHMHAEEQVFAERLRSPEAREAFAAFLEKRQPDFAKMRD